MEEDVEGDQEAAAWSPTLARTAVAARGRAVAVAKKTTTTRPAAKAGGDGLRRVGDEVVGVRRLGADGRRRNAC